MTSVATIGEDVLNTKSETFPSKGHEQLSLLLFSFIDNKHV